MVKKKAKPPFWFQEPRCYIQLLGLYRRFMIFTFLTPRDVLLSQGHWWFRSWTHGSASSRRVRGRNLRWRENKSEWRLAWLGLALASLLFVIYANLCRPCLTPMIWEMKCCMPMQGTVYFRIVVNFFVGQSKDDSGPRRVWTQLPLLCRSWSIRRQGAPTRGPCHLARVWRLVSFKGVLLLLLLYVLGGYFLYRWVDTM